MKIESQVTTMASTEPVSVKIPRKVCMHVWGTAATDSRMMDARVMREATALVEAGFDLTIIDVVSKKNLPDEETIRGVRVQHIKMPSLFISTRFKPWFLVKSAQMVLRGVMKLLSTPTDVYHAHDVNALLPCYVAARLRHKPLIFDSHEIPLDSPSIMRWHRLSALATNILTRMMPRCTAVMTASPLYAREIRDQYHSPEVTSILNVPAYRAITKSDRLRQHLGLHSETQIVLYQGNIQPNRSLERLVYAASFLDKNIVIILMGKAMEATRIQLESLIASEGVADHIKIIPPVPYEELLDWTASADIGLTIFSPDYTRSIRYCLPNKLFEYLMAGLPVLSSKLDAIADVIEAYDVGKVLPSLTPQDVGMAINTMLADPIMLARMRNNALNAAREEFHWENDSKKLVQLYLKVLSR